MKEIIKILVLFISTQCLTGNGFGQGKDDYTAKIDSLLQINHPRSFNGVVLVSVDGKTVYSRAAGYSNLEKKIPLRLEDNFRIQSNSKQITAVLVLQEVEKGKIILDSPVKNYLTEMTQTWADTVTIKQLLNMSAGIINLDRSLAFKPGTGFHYSNPAYGLLGKVIEKVSGKSYAASAHDLFQRLKMKNTYCYEPGKHHPGLVNGYWISRDSTSPADFNKMNFTTASWANFLPAGGIISNAIDMNTWDTKLHNGEILSDSSYISMVNSPVTDSDFTFSDHNSNYGYGVNINEAAPLKYIGHAGRGIGFVSLKIYVPARKLDMVILENTYHRDTDIVYYFEKCIRQIIMNSSLVK